MAVTTYASEAVTVDVSVRVGRGVFVGGIGVRVKVVVNVGGTGVGGIGVTVGVFTTTIIAGVVLRISI